MRYRSSFPIVVPVEELARAVALEFDSLADTLSSFDVDSIQFAPLHAAPDKVEDGMVVEADGTDWDPGAGAGLYIRRSGAWVKLG